MLAGVTQTGCRKKNFTLQTLAVKDELSNRCTKHKHTKQHLTCGEKQKVHERVDESKCLATYWLLLLVSVHISRSDFILKFYVNNQNKNNNKHFMLIFS